MGDLPFIVLAVLLSAFFSGMEIAFISSNKIRLEIAKKQKNLTSKLLKIFTENPNQFISTMLIGNNIALVIFGIYMAKVLEPTIIKIIGNYDLLILFIQTIISTVIILITAEFLPKTLFRIVSNLLLRVFAVPTAFFYFLFYPFVIFSLHLAHWFSRIFLGVDLSCEKNQNVISKMDLDDILSENSEHVEQDEDIDNELKIFQNALDFSSVKLRECIVPRIDIVAVEQATSIEELTDLFVETGYSKIFIYKESIDQIVGYVSSLDLFKSPKSIKPIMRKTPFAPETMAAQNLLETFIQEKRSIAVVVDEFGGTSGIVSFEDILEEIFGEIEDEHDIEDLVAKQLSDGSFLFSGKMEIDHINEQFELDVLESDEYETLAGYILSNYGNFPKQGEVITDIEDDLNSYQIIKASETRIELVKIIPA
ncbi:MAG: hemolysin family protein [Bacteroidota bacterium]|nr:hemolysin family protein [Bacteroidota bacterium]